MDNEYYIIQFLNSSDCPLPENERIEYINKYNTAIREHGGAEGVLRELKERMAYADVKDKIEEYRKRKKEENGEK
ncbi:MAG: hypothetical protein ACI37N_07765 [Prevotella sp.]